MSIILCPHCTAQNNGNRSHCQKCKKDLLTLPNHQTIRTHNNNTPPLREISHNTYSTYRSPVKTRANEASTHSNESPPSEIGSVAGALLIHEAGVYRTVVLREGRTSIGRNPDCNVCLQDGKVSGSHGTLYIEAEQNRYLDTSSNGSHINGKLLIGDKQILKHSDTIKVGTSILTVLLIDNA